MYDVPVLIIFFYLVMTGDDLAAIDAINAIGVPGILLSRAAKTSFVTTASGRALYTHQMSRRRHCRRRSPPSLRPCCRPRPPTTLCPNRRHCRRRPPPPPSLRPCCNPRPPTTLRPNRRHCRRRPPPTPSIRPCCRRRRPPPTTLRLNRRHCHRRPLPTPSLRPCCCPRPPLCPQTQIETICIPFL